MRKHAQTTPVPVQAKKQRTLPGLCGKPMSPGTHSCFVFFMHSPQALNRSRCGQVHGWKHARIAARPPAFLCRPYDLFGHRYSRGLFESGYLPSGMPVPAILKHCHYL